MQIAKIKYKHASQTAYQLIFFIHNYCIVTRTLKINLELNSKTLNNNEDLRKNNQNTEKPICKFLEPKNKYQLLKLQVKNTNCMKYKHAF